MTKAAIYARVSGTPLTPATSRHTIAAASRFAKEVAS